MPTLDLIKAVQAYGLFDAGFCAALLVFAIGIARGWWVMAQRFNDMKTDRDHWRKRYEDVANGAVRHAHRQLDTKE